MRPRTSVVELDFNDFQWISMVFHGFFNDVQWISGHVWVRAQALARLRGAGRPGAPLPGTLGPRRGV